MPDHSGRFVYPTRHELQTWVGSFMPDELDDDLARRLARRVRRDVRWFTASAALPAVLGILIALALREPLVGAPDVVFWPVNLTLAVAVIVATTQWRTLFCWFRPDIALVYYAAACIDRLRDFHPERRGAALLETISYVSGRLADLEDALLSPRLTSRSGGSRTARGVVQQVQAGSAVAIGTAEGRWRAGLDDGSAAGLTSAIGQTLATVALDGWFRIDRAGLMRLGE